MVAARAGRASGASARTALTSRNGLPAGARWAAARRPDLIKSNGGGANAILVRGEAIAEHRVRTLRVVARAPRGARRAPATTRRGSANLHAQAHSEARAPRRPRTWPRGRRRVVGGRARWCSAATSTCARRASAGLRPRRRPQRRPRLRATVRRGGAGRTLDRGPLSDHPPVLAEVAEEGSTRGGVVDEHARRILLAPCAVVRAGARPAAASSNSSSTSSGSSSGASTSRPRPVVGRRRDDQDAEHRRSTPRPSRSRSARR